MAFDDDSRLARKAQRGDRQAFEVILSRYERPIFSFIYHFFRNPALCEDLTQETFLRAFRFIKSFRTKEKLSTWLFSIAKNLCIDELRRMRKGTTVGIDGVDPEELVAEGGVANDPLDATIHLQEGDIVQRSIARLPEKYRICIILFYFNELSYEEISSVMKISLSNTKILLFRGKKMLSGIYRDETRKKM
ncbi:MAG: sigma-70 family RNA polymerase sigma factor [Deltaproteobacteria bacterium]|nr:sigma-70 family RNA polymerase sigma factor [Deltaproteobacteria bacterium]